MSDQEKRSPIIPEGQDFVVEVNKRINSDPTYTSTQYGHAAGALAFILYVNSLPEDHAEAQRMQRQSMINKAKRLLEEFGPNIIYYLKDELKLIIEEEQLLKK